MIPTRLGLDLGLGSVLNNKNISMDKLTLLKSQYNYFNFYLLMYMSSYIIIRQVSES